MFPAADLPDTLALFPVSGAVLLPRARLPMHVFEPRYLTLLEDILKTPHRLVGLVQPVPKDADDRLHLVGCAGRVTSFTETDDGRYMITLTGVSRFGLGEEISCFAPYRKAQAKWSDFSGDIGRAEHDKGFNRASFLPLLRRYLEANELSTDWDRLKDAEDEMLINTLSMLCPFEVEDKQALLESPRLSARRETLVTLIEYALHGGNMDEVMQ